MADIFADIVSDVPTPATPADSGKDIFADIVTANEKDLKKIGFIEAVIQDPLEKIPFSPVGALKVTETLSAIDRLTKDNYTPETLPPVMYGMAYGPAKVPQTPETQRQADIAMVTEFFEEMGERERRGYTLGGRVGSILSNIPAFAIEFAATGGLKQLGSKAAQKAGERLLKQSAKKGLGKAAVGLSKFVAGAGARAVAMPHRAAESILKRRLPKNVSFDDLDNIHITKPNEKVWTSIWKGSLDHYIEVASEQAGEYLGPVINKHIVGRLPFLGKFTGALQRAWLRKFPNKNAGDFLTKLYRKGGFHGILAEVGEEDVGWISRSILNIDDYGAGKDATIGERLKAGLAQDIDNLPAELIAFSVPGAMARSTNFLLDRGQALPKYNVVKVNAETGKVISNEGAFDSPLAAYEAVKEKATPDDRYNKIEYEIREPGESLTKPRTYDETGTAEEAYAAEERRKEEVFRKESYTYNFEQPKGRYLVKQIDSEGNTVFETRFESEEEAALFKQGADEYSSKLPSKHRGITEIIKSFARRILL